MPGWWPCRRGVRPCLAGHGRYRLARRGRSNPMCGLVRADSRVYQRLLHHCPARRAGRASQGRARRERGRARRSRLDFQERLDSAVQRQVLQISAVVSDHFVKSRCRCHESGYSHRPISRRPCGTVRGTRRRIVSAQRGADSAMTCAIRAARTLSARHRTSCKWVANATPDLNAGTAASLAALFTYFGATDPAVSCAR